MIEISETRNVAKLRKIHSRENISSLLYVVLCRRDYYCIQSHKDRLLTLNSFDTDTDKRSPSSINAHTSCKDALPPSPITYGQDTS